VADGKGRRTSSAKWCRRGSARKGATFVANATPMDKAFFKMQIPEILNKNE
jgi:hypothetical protein